MISKLYEKLKTFIKGNYKEIIFLILLLIVLNYKLDYSIMVSGGTINVNDRVSIENSSTSNGSFNMAYVTELKGTIPTVLLSYVMPSWTKVDIDEYKASKNESIEDIQLRSKVYLEASIQAAIKVAYDKAGKNFNYSDYKFYIVYIDDKSESDLKVGDILLKVNGEKITDIEQYVNVIQKSNIGDILDLTVNRNGKEENVKIKVKLIDDEKITGVSILQLYDYSTNPKLSVKFKKSESGPSGGLMLSLAIYDKLVSEDLTKGLKIVGTGTIEFDGSIGPIDGIEYKLKGAVKDKADIFIAPSGENYEDCIKLKEKKGYKIKIIEAKTFDQVIKELADIK